MIVTVFWVSRPANLYVNFSEHNHKIYSFD